jgi:hypothetical protein
MSGKILPFKGDNTKEKELKEKNPNLTDSGKFGDLSFEVYDKWQTIHLIEKNMVFKKDCEIFEDQFDEIDFELMKEGETAKIEGSGDNADLIITIKEGDAALHLENKKLPGIRRLKNLLSKSKEKVLGKGKRRRRSNSQTTKV